MSKAPSQYHWHIVAQDGTRHHSIERARTGALTQSHLDKDQWVEVTEYRVGFCYHCDNGPQQPPKRHLPKPAIDQPSLIDDQPSLL